MPATPMKEAAERYSPEIADAFQPTETERPATKKSLAVFDCRADQKPMPIVTATATKENAKIQGPTPPNMPSASMSGRERTVGNVMVSAAPFRCAPARLHRPRARLSA